MKEQDKSIESSYKEDPEKLINRKLSLVNKLQESGSNEIKEKKSWLRKQLNNSKNKFKNYFKNKKKK